MVSERVLIIVPAFNEGRVIGRHIKELMTLYPKYDVLVINDRILKRAQEELKKEGRLNP